MKAPAKGFDLFAVITIAGMSLGVAVVTYGVLKSSGAADAGATQLGGAVVGFVASFGLISRVYKQLVRGAEQAEQRQWIAENRRLNDQVDELSQKLIRGAPRPEGYSVELLEQHKLVLARPSGFESRGGVILDIQEPESKVEKEGKRLIDFVPARLYVNYMPAPAKQTADEYYRGYHERACASTRHDVMAVERTSVGSDGDACEALKVTTRRCVRVTLRADSVPGRFTRSIEPLPRDEWLPHRAVISPERFAPVEEVDDPAYEDEAVVALRTTVVVCLNRAIDKVYFFAFEDDEENFTHNVAILNRCLRSVRFLT